MKTIILISLVVIVTISCTKNKSLMIGGRIEGYKSGDIYLKKYVGEDFIVIDTTESKAGKFSFKGSYYSPDLYLIEFEEHKIQFFLENTSVSIETSIENPETVKFEDGGVNEKYNLFKKELSELKEQKGSLRKEYLEKEKRGCLGEKEADSLITEVDEIDDKIDDFLFSYVKNNNHSITAPYIIQRHLLFDIEYPDLIEIINALEPDFGETFYLSQFRQKAKVLEKTAIGNEYTDFSLADTSNTEVTLSSILGKKYTLLVFWSFSCGPCRKENKELNEIYKKYIDKGLQIIGISIDNEPAKWKSAIDMDKYVFSQLIDKKNVEGISVKDLYAIPYNPYAVLINGEGLIIHRNIRLNEFKKIIENL